MTSSLFLDDDILPPPPAGAVPILHDREYRVQSWRLSRERLLVQGAIRDQKPPGLFIPGDPDPLTIHHMQLSLEIAVKGLEIVGVNTEFATHPQAGCTGIIGHYDKLIGLSLTRGFTHKVRELFGGPRGCSHTTALLQAMAPIAMQSLKGMEVFAAEEDGLPHPIMERAAENESWKRLLNTCHVWAEDQPLIRDLRDGVEREQTLPVAVRLRSLQGE